MFVRSAATGVPKDVANLVMMMQDDMVTAFDSCLQNLKPSTDAGFGAPTAVAQAVLLRWFGSNSQATANEVLLKVRQMRMVLRNVSLVLNWQPDADFQGAAHRQFSFPPGIMVGNEATKVRAMNSVGPQSINYSISLTSQWLAMPNYAMGMPSTWRDGDKFECLVHELSHVVLGTVDVESTKTGRIAYGGNSCRALARSNPAKALTNADNWGFFIEEFHEYATMAKYG